jgi:hypothetical protein
MLMTSVDVCLAYIIVTGLCLLSICYRKKRRTSRSCHSNDARSIHNELLSCLLWSNTQSIICCLAVNPKSKILFKILFLYIGCVLNFNSEYHRLPLGLRQAHYNTEGSTVQVRAVATLPGTVHKESLTGWLFLC